MQSQSNSFKTERKRYSSKALLLLDLIGCLVQVWYWQVVRLCVMHWKVENILCLSKNCVEKHDTSCKRESHAWRVVPEENNGFTGDVFLYSSVQNADYTECLRLMLLFVYPSHALCWCPTSHVQCCCCCWCCERKTVFRAALNCVVQKDCLSLCVCVSASECFSLYFLCTSGG